MAANRFFVILVLIALFVSLRALVQETFSRVNAPLAKRNDGLWEGEWFFIRYTEESFESLGALLQQCGLCY